MATDLAPFAGTVRKGFRLRYGLCHQESNQVGAVVMRSTDLAPFAGTVRKGFRLRYGLCHQESNQVGAVVIQTWLRIKAIGYNREHRNGK
jgi:hypothetical protein